MHDEGPVILLVEDSDSDALLIEQAFRKARILNKIIRLSAGMPAISYLEAKEARKESPVFVLLDLSLPDLSGYEILRWIRSHPASRELPAVIVTGSDHPEERATSFALGANAFFRKTLNFEDLIALVRSVGGCWRLQTSLGNEEGAPS